jgi:hypothetical protein
LSLSRCNLPPLHSSPFSPILCYLTVFSMFPCVLWCISLLFAIFLSFFSSYLCLLYQSVWGTSSEYICMYI